MPVYKYSCNDCGQPFSQTKSIEARYNVECPCCGAWGGREKKDGSRSISITPPKIHFIRDIDSTEGRVHDAVPMPAFGPDVAVTSRSQLRDLQKDAREKIMESTGGRKTLNVTDPETGKRETITVEREPLDVGEIHTAESRPQPIDHGEATRQQVMKQITAEARVKGVAPR